MEILREEGYMVDAAENGESGLEKFKRDNYDIVITDLIMSPMGVLKEVKCLKPKTHVILITAFATVENAVEAMKAGASEYISLSRSMRFKPR